MTATAVVLCGGASSRMGRPKALLPWRGGPMLAHVVSVLREAVDRVVVVTSEGLDLPPLPARVVRDREPGLGPLAGIREGLEAAGGGLVFVTATDAPFLTAAFVRAMLSFGVAAAVEVDGVLQPLGAVYPASAAGTAAELLAGGRKGAVDLLKAVGARRVRPEELPGIESLRNLNTPEDYRRALLDSPPPPQ